MTVNVSETTGRINDGAGQILLFYISQNKLT